MDRRTRSEHLHESPWVVTRAARSRSRSRRSSSAGSRSGRCCSATLRRRDLRASTSTTCSHELGEEFHGPAAFVAACVSSRPRRLSRARRRRRRLVPVPEAAGPAGAHRCAHSRGSTRLLVNKYYFDWFNENVLATGVRTSARASGSGATRPSSTAGSSTAARGPSACCRPSCARCRRDISITMRSR